MRKKMLATALASVAIAALVPGTASAAPDWEINYGVEGSVPADVVCANQMDKVWICYQRNGDRWWVRDNAQDGMSALVQWWNYQGGSLHRRGRCINSHGAGTWAYCDKDYAETSKLNGVQGAWDRSSGAEPVFYDQVWGFQ